MNQQSGGSPIASDRIRLPAGSRRGSLSTNEQTSSLPQLTQLQSKGEKGMPRIFLAALVAAASVGMASVASAEPVKIALIESLSGGQAVTGKLFQTAVKYGLARLEADNAWPDGIQLLEYDNQGGPSAARSPRTCRSTMPGTPARK